MINLLSYIGMNVHSEVCLWTLLGLMRTIFDATLFRVNANLKQVWQMSMPEELSMSVQRALRTMISGVMLVQCFTVYVYLASYIVLLYPVFLEERPTLVLPWLLLAAVRKLLCELMSLALGLGTCVLLGPNRPPCIKFVIIKLISIMPSFYMWMLLFSYYHALKVATAFKTFPVVLPSGEKDYGLELAIRRRKTKSLLDEEQLRSKLVASLYREESSERVTSTVSNMGTSSRMIHSTDTSAIDVTKSELDGNMVRPNSFISNHLSETGSCDDWLGKEIVLPRSCDRILEQFVLMLLRVAAYLSKEGIDMNSKMFTNKSALPPMDDLHCVGYSAEVSETPLLVSSSKENMAQYLREYPQIFRKKSVDVPRNDNKVETSNMQTHHETEDSEYRIKARKRAVKITSKETVFTEPEHEVKVITDVLEELDPSHVQGTLTSIFNQSSDTKLSEADVATNDMSSISNKNNKNENDHYSGTRQSCIIEENQTEYEKETMETHEIQKKSSLPGIEILLEERSRSVSDNKVNDDGKKIEKDLSVHDHEVEANIGVPETKNDSIKPRTRAATITSREIVFYNDKHIDQDKTDRSNTTVSSHVQGTSTTIAKDSTETKFNDTDAAIIRSGSTSDNENVLAHRSGIIEENSTEENKNQSTKNEKHDTGK